MGEHVEYLGFQRSAQYVPPVWPPEDGKQQMMLHIDIEVPELESAVAEAVAAGARLATHQPQEKVRVLLDQPATPSASTAPDRSLLRPNRRCHGTPTSRPRDRLATQVATPTLMLSGNLSYPRRTVSSCPITDVTLCSERGGKT